MPFDEFHMELLNETDTRGIHDTAVLVDVFLGIVCEYYSSTAANSSIPRREPDGW